MTFETVGKRGDWTTVDEPRTSVSKRRRDVDIEDRRQRRMGATGALAAAGGLALGARGVQGAVGSSKLLRISSKFAAKNNNKAIADKGQSLIRGGISASGREQAQIAGGSALVATGYGIKRNSNNSRGRRYN